MRRYHTSTTLAELRQTLDEWNTAIRGFESFGIHAPQAYYRQREEVRLRIADLELVAFDRAHVTSAEESRRAA